MDLQSSTNCPSCGTPLDKGLDHLAALPELWILEIKGTKVTDAGAARLKKELSVRHAWRGVRISR